MTTVPPPRFDANRSDRQVLRRDVQVAGAEPDLLPAVAKLLNEADAPAAWQIEAGPIWHVAQPLGSHRRDQSWLLHLSATPRTVATLLDRVVPLLRTEGTVFAFAPSRAIVGWLATDACGYADFGKVLTAQPTDDAGFTSLAERLHRLTADLAGPRVVSARAYRSGGVVHYRYGRFATPMDGSDTGPDDQLDNDGLALWHAGSGSTTRHPSGSPTVSRSSVVEHGESRLLGGRYVRRATLRNGPAVSVHLACDEYASPATDVLLVHARAHANPEPDGSDARGRLLAEARLLRRLAPHVRTARPLRVVATNGDVVMVKEHVAGEPLRQWIRRHAAAGAGPPPGPALRLARRLVALVGAVHRAGVVLRNLHPAQIVVTTDGVPALVDLGDAADADADVARSGAGAAARRGPATCFGGMPGYEAPELRAAAPAEPTRASQAADRYSLGGLLFLLATGNDPVLADDDPSEHRPDRDRLAGWLALVARYDETARLLAPAIMSLMAEDPAERIDLPQVERLLLPASAAPARLPTSQPTGEELLSDGLDYLAATMSPDGSRLWPTGPAGARTDPRNVQHGAAGVLAVLLRAHADRVPAEIPPAALEASVRKAASWLGQHCGEGGPSLPGLYFGRSGVAWVLAEAAMALDEPQLLTQAEQLAMTVPTRWPNPDVAHGLAGAALTQLRLARLTMGTGVHRFGWTGPAIPARWSYDGKFLARAASYAEALRSAALTGPYGPTWPIPSAFASRLAGASHYGFAHGVAGIGYTLLALGTALDDAACTTLAVEAGYTLCRAARTDDNGAAWWPVGPADPTRLPHWCSGSSGVGTFLLRLSAVTGEQRFAEYARAAAGAVYHARWASAPSACHGLAGDGQFLLDAADILGDRTYRAWAEDLVPLLAVRHCRRDGRALIPDETSRGVVADYNVGLAGVLAFLLRLRHGGPRLFQVDDLLLEDGQQLVPEAVPFH